VSRAPLAERITAEQFLGLPESKGEELVDGQIVFTMRGVLNSLVGGDLLYRIRSRPEFEDPNWVFAPGCGLRINELTVRNPSLMVIRRDQLPKLDDRFLEVVPKLLVEVTSPIRKPNDLERRLAEYKHLDIPLIWVIDTTSRSVVVHGANRPSIELGPDGALDGEDVLPGFRQPLTDLFEAADEVQ
jgi:Uma2 family endonuclease